MSLRLQALFDKYNWNSIYVVFASWNILIDYDRYSVHSRMKIFLFFQNKPDVISYVDLLTFIRLLHTPRRKWMKLWIDEYRFFLRPTFTNYNFLKTLVHSSSFLLFSFFIRILGEKNNFSIHSNYSVFHCLFVRVFAHLSSEERNYCLLLGTDCSFFVFFHFLFLSLYSAFLSWSLRLALIFF